MKHKLKLLIDKEEEVCNFSRIWFVERKKSLEDLRHEHMCFSIIPKDSKEEVKELPTKVADMLEEFFDIVSDNVLDGLSLIRKINYQK